jgi:signal transduction histidine kinase
MELHQAIDAILLLHRHDFRKRQIAVVRRFAARLPQILAVPDQIKQVFLNLLTNAADACHDRGGTITITTRRGQHRVIIRFADTGVGIKPEDRERIFEPFFTTKPEIKGTGLGLPVCYGIVKQHHGEIRVKSTPGKGTAVTLFLPIQGSCQQAERLA